jgi:hypothetical protein
MRSIFPKLFLASAVLATAALTASSALAETTVNVPFSFTANGKVCPAGRYSVEMNATHSVVMLRSRDSSRNFQWLASSGEPAPSDTRVILRFDVHGSDHALQTVQYHSFITSRLDGKKKAEPGPTQVIMGQ